MKKIIFLMTAMSLLSALVTSTVIAQEKLLLQYDTLKIGEVKVLPDTPDGKKGFKVSNVDKDLLKTLAANSVATTLSIGTPLYIKTYGEGGTASSSFRGMGASHTQVLWEGIRIDNPMTGQTDLSTLITAFIDDVKLFNGGTPMIFGNRGAGGTVSVGSDIQWDKGMGLEYKQKIGSFSNFIENIDFSTSSSLISYRLRAYHQKSDNDYEYKDVFGSDDVLKRTGADYKSKGMMHELNLKSNKTVYGAKLWYNKSDRKLPGSIEYPTVVGNEKQSDETIRAILSFKNYLNKGEIEGKMAYNSDWMHYENEMWMMDSRNKVNSVNGRLNGIYRLSISSKLSFGLDYRSTSIHSNNYEENIKRNQASAELSYNTLVKNRLGLFVSLNEELVNKELNRISPSAGFDLGIIKNKDYHLKGTIGLSNHLPTINDLYWLPGGNPDLETERAINYETTFSYKDVIMNSIMLEGSITGYQSLINDMIQWVPVSEYVWTPENVAEVLSRGVEIDQKISYFQGNHIFKLIGSYYYTSVSSQKAVSDEDNTVGKQLAYVPKHKAAFAVVYKLNEFILTWNSLYTGERFVNEDNSESLSANWHSSASVEQLFKIKSLELGAGLSVNNIFNKDYQSVRNYPMPWRSYMLSLSVKFNTRKS